MSDIPKNGFTSEWYDEEYFAGLKGGKKYRKPNGTIGKWSYFNPSGELKVAELIAKAWKTMFNPRNALDVGSGRGTFVAYMRNAGIEAYGFDFSEWAVGEGRYKRCKPEWLILHDATKPWPWNDRSFDLVTALDFFEHIYIDDLDFVIKEMFRVANKWIFLQIAVVGGGSGAGIHDKGFIIRRGEKIPRELEGAVVAGHVTVQPAEWWRNKLMEIGGDEWMFRRDMENWFFALVPEAYVPNWSKNSVMVLERI